MDEFDKFQIVVKFRDGDTPLRSTTLDIGYDELVEMVMGGMSDPLGVLLVRVDGSKVMMVACSTVASVLLIGVK
jgi:hypothetical protein